MKRCLLLALTVLGMYAVPAAAELQIGGGIEYFDWREDTNPEVKETGPMLAFHIDYAQDIKQGWLFAATGRLWGGSVDYEGAELATNRPLTGTTDYFGVGAEAQMRYRLAAGASRVDFVLGLSWDAWNRQLTDDQSEQYAVFSVHPAVEIAPAQAGAGFVAGIGVKYPFYIYENANFDDIGATNNPTLRPKGAVSATAHLGYRFNKQWQMSLYYESIWMDDSDPVFVNFRSGSSLSSGLYYQPGSHLNVIGLRAEFFLR